MDPLDALAQLARTDAIAALPFAIGIAAVALYRRQRPLTFNRIVEVGLPAILLMMLGVRYALLAPVTALMPAKVLAPSAGPALGAGLAGLYVAASVIGFMSWKESVGWKLVGAVTFLVVTVLEASLNLFVLDEGVVPRIDTGVSILIAAITILFGIFNWAHRAATPSPLGGANGPPLDY